MLAALLARGGMHAIVLERDSVPKPVVRPEILWPASVELLSSLVPRAELEREAIMPLRGVEFVRKGKSIVAASPGTFERARVQPWTTDPGATRARLLALPGIEVRRGVEAIGLSRDGNRVSGVRARELAGGREFEMRATWTIGDDGAASMVRAACGIGIATRMFPNEFFCAAFDWPASFAPGVARIHVNPDPEASCIVALAAIPLPRGRGVALAVVHGKKFRDAKSTAQDWKRFRERAADLDVIAGARRLPEDFVRIQRPWGHAERYGIPGAALLGDALHPVSPAGGQGANMAMHDARVLADLLLARDADLLGAYERRRRPANARSVAITRRAAFFFELIQRGGLLSLPARMLPFIVRRQAIVVPFVRGFSKTFVERTSN
jgi:2-polyprenyl-6-methoxyphenol hydroxylase-like FAD-dependent oxidoreductase